MKHASIWIEVRADNDEALDLFIGELRNEVHPNLLVDEVRVSRNQPG